MLQYLRITVAATSLIACMLLIALWVRSYYFHEAIERKAHLRLQPVEWGVYSEQAKSATLDSGKSVVLFVYAELSPASAEALQHLQPEAVSKLVKGDEFVALLLKYDDWNDPRIVTVWRDIDMHTKEPFIVFYAPDTAPVAFNATTLELLRVKYNL